MEHNMSQNTIFNCTSRGMARLSVILLLQSLAFSLFAQNPNSVGINTTSVDPSAIMEVKADTPGSATKKGFLPPRLELKNQRDKTTVPIATGTERKATAMLVYNTENTYNFSQGHVYSDNYYYWLGDRWERMVYTPLVYEAVIPRAFYSEGKTKQEFTTEQLNPPYNNRGVN